MTSQLAETIHKNLIGINRKVPNLNRGGCGVFAVYFAEIMQSYGFNAKIIQICEHEAGFFSYDTDYYKDHFKEKNSIVHNAVVNHKPIDGEEVAIGAHYCVQIDDFYFDSNKVSILKNNEIALAYKYDIVGEVSVKDMEYVSIDSRGNIWNEMYNPKYNAVVKAFITHALSASNI